MYWKYKIFEFMCSNCGYFVTEEEAKELKVCPNCGEEYEEDDH